MASPAIVQSGTVCGLFIQTEWCNCPMTDSRIDTLFESPELMFRDFKVDSRPVMGRFLPMSDLGYRASSFHDGRGTAEGVEGVDGLQLALSDLLSLMHAASRPIRETHFLLQVGHAGSTLLSRLIGELPGHFAIRDPLPLLRVARGAILGEDSKYPLDKETLDQMMAVTIGLLGRTWNPDEVALVKPGFHAFATYANLVEAHPKNRFILLDLPLETYLATLLRPFQLPEQKNAVSQIYSRTWAAVTGEALATDELSPGELVAVMWLINQLSLAAVETGAPSRVTRLTFDDYLADPAGQLIELTRFLGVDHEPDLVEHLVTSPLVDRYAKDTEHEYSLAMRDEALRSARDTYADEIRAGQVFAFAKMRDHSIFAALEGRS
jgi:hypothetical protein